MCAIPVLSALLAWRLSGGHLSAAETSNLMFGHLLYGALIGAIALFAASITESSATAAIVTLAFTIGSWVLDFTLAGRPGLLEWVAGLSLTQIVRSFEQGLLAFEHRRRRRRRRPRGFAALASRLAAAGDRGSPETDALGAVRRGRRGRARPGDPRSGRRAT